MAEIITSTQAEPEYPTEQQEPQRLSALWQRIALGAILLISVFMNFYKLGQVGFTTYYPPAVRSMLDNWHNFFFAAYDPGGFSSIDKPPVGFWLQVISAKIFGFTPISVLLPQALCGVLAVLLLYSLIRHQFGVTAGLLATLALAISPISVVTNRNVTIDSTLTLVMLVGAWAILRAASTGRLRWLLLCAAIIGVGFNIKMLEAYLVLPAFGLLYLLAAPVSIWKRLWHLALALLLLLVVSFSWAAIVDLTPASQRPHVGSTQDNSEIGLALGYNGIQRLLGTGGGATTSTPQSSGNQPALVNGNTGTPPVHIISTPVNGGTPPVNAATPSTNNGGATPAHLGGVPANAEPTPVGNFVSTLFSLFTEPFGSQNGWLLPLAIFGIIALVKLRRPRPQRDRTLQALILWGMWLLTMGTFFSVGSIHEYYLTVMSPAIAALCGIGLVTMWQDYHCSGWRAWLLPLAIITTTAEQVSILNAYPDWGRRMTPLLIVLCLVAVAALICAHLPLHFTRKVPWQRLLLPALAPGLVALAFVPALWAAVPILQGIEGDLPHAGPLQTMVHGPGAAQVDPALLRYLEANQGNAQLLLATAGVDTDQVILATNKQVMPLDGFSNYPLTTTELASLVAQGKLHFLLIHQLQTQAPALGFGKGIIQGAPTGLDDVLAWTTQHCKTVSPSQWQTSATSSSGGNVSGPNAPQLYDCAAAH
jgi:4-amino-4-deoxy-L-arabinose transferase-like glycosyltransferase